MPLTSDEWEEVRTREDLMNDILDFLEKEKPNAYSFMELVNEIEYDGKLDTKSWKGQAHAHTNYAYEYEKALGTLEDRKEIESKRYKGDTYYRAI